MMYRKLSDAEAEEFRKWARKNYKIDSPINGVWHPIVQQECVLMNQEAATMVADKTP